MTNKRDDFSEAVKRALCERVGGFCSNPNCRVATIGPHSDPGRRVSVGEAAHITAATPSGPRYNPNLSSSQRSCADNGIWLCSACADLIDKDPNAYSIETLITWKMQAEAEQASRLLNPRQSEISRLNISNYVIINNEVGSVTDDLVLWRE